MLIHFVLVTSSNELRNRLKRHLGDPDVRVNIILPGPSAWQNAVRSCGDIIVIDEAIIPKPVDSGLTMLNNLPENPTTVVLHGNDSSEELAQLVAAGADAVLYAGLSSDRIASALETIVESRRQLTLKNRLDKMGRIKPTISDFVSQSEVMKILIEEVKQIVTSDCILLILGETGVGKEHLAKAIHSDSPRSAGPFVAVNVAALPEQLLESELFGHAQGAFTGADRARRGAFELAHGGTIFLDEIGELPLHLQSKLLRVLQDYEFRPIGAEASVWVDVRVMAATNLNLDEDVASGNFRKDLFFRLSVVTLTIPPLRERIEDIPSLAQLYLKLNCQRRGSEIDGFDDDALQALLRYDWPGNVRELMNVIERAVILCKSESISRRDLPQMFQHGLKEQISLSGPLQQESWKQMTLPQVRKEVLDKVDRDYVSMLLAETGGRLGQAASRAGIHPRGLYDIMKRLNLKKQDFKRPASPESEKSPSPPSAGIRSGHSGT